MHVDKTDDELMAIAGKKDLETYDLKGSWVGRSTATEKDGRKRDVEGEFSTFQNPDFLLRNPDFLLRNPDFIIKHREHTER